MSDENDDMIYCVHCGASNPPDAEICSSCNNELSRPHPIQLAGGDIYALRCSQCGQRLAVLKMQGRVNCVSCGAVHTIEAGPGYLTVRVVPGLIANDNEEEYLLGQTLPADTPPVPTISPDIQAMATTQAENLKRIKDLEIGLKVKTMRLKDHISRKKGGVVLLLISLAGAGFSIIDALNRTRRYGLFDPLLFVFSMMLFLIAFVLLLTSGRRKKQKLEQEISGMNEELAQLRSSTALAGKPEGGHNG